MRICFVCEGSYPYVAGGVSGWVDGMIRSYPDIEFVVLAVCADRSSRGKFVYDLPENLTEVHEIYLQDADWDQKRGKRIRSRLTSSEYEALRSLLLNRDIRWDEIFELFRNPEVSVDDILMGPDFFHAVQEYYDRDFPEIVFSDFLWTLRSIYLPLFLVMKSEIPEADLYHCTATGYGGILGAMAQQRFGCGFLLSEHGIYTREREEELIRAKWVQGIYKNIWISQFHKMSRLAYDRADLVTSLFSHARELQIELDCPPEKAVVTPNGVDPERFRDIPGKQEEDRKYINVGAVLRVTMIKDVKTLIHAFAQAKARDPRLRLWIMGPVDEEPEYAGECLDLVRDLGLAAAVTAEGHEEDSRRERLDGEEDAGGPHPADVLFTGRIDVTRYLGRMDFTILTSISEGQPLTILESFAAKKPVIATDVGNCRGLLYGEEDDFGAAGVLTHIMDIEEIAAAILELSGHPELRREMGENGYRRLMHRYTLKGMQRRYAVIYQWFCRRQELPMPGSLKKEEEEEEQYGRNRR